MLHLSGPAPWLLAWLTGTAFQLFQPSLWSLQSYAWWAAAGCLFAWLSLWFAKHRSSAQSHFLRCGQVSVALCLGTGGALSVYKQHKQTQLWSSITDAHWLSQRLPLQRCEDGQSWLWDGVQFDFIHPLPTDYDKTMTPNARSCVLRIRAQSQTVLLTADIEAMQEAALVQRMGSELKADVLLVPHHGSKTSSTEVFIDAVQPRWALLQHGYRNRY